MLSTVYRRNFAKPDSLQRLWYSPLKALDAFIQQTQERDGTARVKPSRVMPPARSLISPYTPWADDHWPAAAAEALSIAWGHYPREFGHSEWEAEK